MTIHLPEDEKCSCLSPYLQTNTSDIREILASETKVTFPEHQIIPVAASALL